MTILAMSKIHIAALQEELNSIYIRIGEGEPITDELSARIEKLEDLLNPFEVKLLSFEDWCSEEGMEEKYEQFYDEYGDASCSLSEYKERHYQEYARSKIPQRP